MSPHVLVAVFLQATNVGGSDATISLTKHLRAELTYLIAESRDPVPVAFSGVTPLPNVIHNPLKSKPHMRVGAMTWRQFWYRNQNIYKDVRWLRDQQRIVQRVQPDVVCSMTTMMRRADLFFVQFLRAESFLRTYGYTPTQAERLMQFLDLKERHMLMLERENMKAENHRFIVVTSLATKRAVQTHYRIPDERIILVRNAIDTNIFTPSADIHERNRTREQLGLSPDDFAVLFVGRSPERKGIDILLTALHRIANNNIVAILVGFDDNPYVTNILKTLNIRTIFVGEVPTAELVTTYYGTADVFVLSSRVEPYGGVILEAMACGLPVVVSQYCGAAEVIDHDRTGFVLTADDTISELAQILAELQRDPDRRRVVGAEAHQEMITARDWRTQSHIIQGLVDMIAERNHFTARTETALPMSAE